MCRYFNNNRYIKRIPVYTIQRISKYNKYIDEHSKNGVVPSDSAICKDLKLTELQLKDLRKIIYEAECISTSELLPGTEDSTVEDSIADPLDLEDQIVENVAIRQAEIIIWKIVDELEKQKADIIVSRYKKSSTLREIGERLNLSTERVRAIEKTPYQFCAKNAKLAISLKYTGI